VHALAPPTAEYWPATHVAQELCDVEPWKRPEAQSEQDVAAAAE